MKSPFIVIDGIAGSGKTTIMKAVQEYLHEKGLSSFNQQLWSNENREPPRDEDFLDKDILYTFEPTKYWIGEALRKEMFFDDIYDMEIQAQAFSLDRMVHYNRIIVPAMQANKIIIQDRSITSSIAMQGIVMGENRLEMVMNLPGNAVALENMMTDIILTKVDIDIVQKRMKTRDDDSKGIHERLDWLDKVQRAFHGERFKEIFLKKNVRIHSVDTGGEISETIIEVKKIIDNVIYE